MALLARWEMSDLSPQSGRKRTLSRHRRMTESDPTLGHSPLTLTISLPDEQDWLRPDLDWQTRASRRNAVGT
jgi:hypothetical protein